MNDDYLKLLDEAYKQVPEGALNKERFEMPKVKVIYEGNKSIVSNFSDITKIFHREEEHFKKFLQKELAAYMEIKRGKLEVGRRISLKFITQKITKYCDHFVLCNECNRPDTTLLKEDGVLSVKCMACGAKHPVKIRI